MIVERGGSGGRKDLGDSPGGCGCGCIRIREARLESHPLDDPPARRGCTAGGVAGWLRIPASRRLWLALGGGLLVGFASRLAGGCTSGQALTGSALLLTGSIIFLVCLFTGGYAAAHFFRRQWDD